MAVFEWLNKVNEQFEYVDDEGHLQLLVKTDQKIIICFVIKAITVTSF